MGNAAVEIWEDPEAAWGLRVDERLRALGVNARVVRSPVELRQGDRPPAALMVNALLPEACLEACLRQHGADLREGGVVGIVFGRSVPRGRRERLREAGFGLFLGAPFDPAALRFQVNRAFLAHRSPGPPRREQRAPIRMHAEVRAHERVKAAQLYTVSEGGAFLETPRPWMEGTRLEIRVPGALGRSPLRARVVYTNVPGNLRQRLLPVGMGVRFEALEGAPARALRAAIRERCDALLL